MKMLTTITVIALSISLQQATAQTEAPAGFKKGSVVLADKSIVSGFIKEKIKSNSSLVLTDEKGEKKKLYYGSELTSATIEDNKYICLKGDFFKVLTEGELVYLQKASDASGQPSYNGTEALFNNGTEGTPGDYFIYDNRRNDLKRISKKSFDNVIAASFADCVAALDRAKMVHNDPAQLKDAVELYNNRNKK